MPKNPYKYPVVCFYCDRAIVYTVQNKNLAISDAKKRGWSLGEYPICPDCKKKPKQELIKIRTDKFFNVGK